MLELWDARAGALVRTFGEQGMWLRSCAIDGEGKLVVAVVNGNALYVLDTRTGETHPFSDHGATIRDCAISANGTTIVSTADDQALRIWDAHAHTCLATLYVDGKLGACACTSDGEYIVATSEHDVYMLKLLRSSAGSITR
jgi:hypothetical protein